MQKNILFFIRFFMKPFPIAVVLLLYKNLIFFLRIWSPYVVLYYRKHFYSILTDLSKLSHTSHQQFLLLSSDLIWKMFSQNTFQQCSRSLMFFKIGLLIHFPIFTRKYLCWSLFLIKLHAWWPATLLKNRPLHRCFPVNITKCLRMAFFMEHLWWLLLKMVE